MKKTFAILLTMAILVSMLTACGKNETATPEGSLSVDSPIQNEEFSANEPAAPSDETTDSETAPAEQPDANAATSDTQKPTEKPAVSDSSKSETTKPATTSKPTQSSANKPAASKPSTGSSSSSNTSSSSGSNSSSGQTSASINSLSLSKIVDKIYEIHPVDLHLSTDAIDISNADVLKSYTGLSDASKIQEVYASEPMMSSQAYSLVMVRTKHASDAASIGQEMFKGINTRKWVCVEADDLQVAVKGNTIMLFMIDSSWTDCATSAQMVSAFQSVCGGSLDAIYK
jgi:hypothetical protein